MDATTLDKPLPVDQLQSDPVCGMKVDSDGKYRHKYNGTLYHFCSAHCLDKFQTTPDKYINLSASASSSHNAQSSQQELEYTCPMHPEVQQIGPGDCPKCGMALERWTPTLGQIK